MSQEIFDTIDPVISGTTLATILNDFKAALVSGLSGTTRPIELEAGGAWLDITLDPVSWSYKIWTGTSDVEVFRINLATSLASVALAVEEFSIKKITADTNGALLKLVKNRIANNGQVLDGDTVGEIQFVGRADDASNPVVGKMVWVASDDMTTSAYGGEFAFYSTPDGTATLTKHFRLVSGLFETIVPHKLNSLRLVGTNVATTATIAQLTADTVLVEMTGATATSIQGIKSDDDSQVVTIHNRSTAAVTLKHQDLSATANDRMKLPSSSDYIIPAQGTATLYYCTADTKWKLKSTSDKNFTGLTVDTYYGAYNSAAIPAGVTTVRVRAYRKMSGMSSGMSGLNDIYGNAYAWGINTNGQLGLGDVAARSSPVIVTGGLSFLRTFGLTGPTTTSTFGIATTGVPYAWGANLNGQLGVGDVLAKSAPTVILGSLKFNTIYPRDASVLALTTGNQAYGWGINTNGQLGVGDAIPRSSPVAVLLGFRWSKLIPLSGNTAEGSVVGLTTSGVAYAWGINSNGQLGLGDVIPRSSPVVVLGGLTFANIYGGATSSRYFFVGLLSTGAAYAWGANTKGSLGSSDTTARSSPVAVVGGLFFKEIITHPLSEAVFGMTTAGVLYAWGDNLQGILGVGDNTARSSPVLVLGGLTFVKVKHFSTFVVGLTSDGTAYAWGSNNNGQLANADVVSRSSPVAVLGGFKFFDVFNAYGISDVTSVFGVQADGTVYAWGNNLNGTLGLGDITPRSSPVAVVGSLRADTAEQSFSADLTVLPSTSYIIGITSGLCYFGNTPLGHNAYKVEVEYLT